MQEAWYPYLPIIHIAQMDGQKTLCKKECSDWHVLPELPPAYRLCGTCKTKAESKRGHAHPLRKDEDLADGMGKRHRSDFKEDWK